MPRDAHTFLRGSFGATGGLEGIGIDSQRIQGVGYVLERR